MIIAIMLMKLTLKFNNITHEEISTNSRIRNSNGGGLDSVKVFIFINYMMIPKEIMAEIEKARVGFFHNVSFKK